MTTPMNSQDFDTIEQAREAAMKLISEQKWAVAIGTSDTKYVLKWIEHKKYTAFDGKEYPDEIWTTEQNELKLVQDLEPEHARNIIRMMLRNEREAKEQIDNLLTEMANVLKTHEEELDDLSDYPEPSSFNLPEPDKNILH